MAKRNEGVDFLRVVLILMIIAHHLLLRGPVSLALLDVNKFEPQNAVFAFVNCFLIVSVNCFFLISGFFGIHTNYKKSIKLIISVYIFFGIINLIALLLKIESVDFELIKGFAFPISQYWFVFVYIVLSFVAPYIEKFIVSISIEDEKKIIVILFIVWCGYCFLIDNEIFGANRGYSFMSAVLLYLVGNYVKRSNWRPKACLSFASYIIFSLVNGVFVLLLINCDRQRYAWKMFSYNNPIVIVSSVCLFVSFLGLNSNKFVSGISRLGKYSVYNYVIHSTPVFANWYMGEIDDWYRGDAFKLSLLFLCVVIILFVIGTLGGFLYEQFFVAVNSVIYKKNKC